MKIKLNEPLKGVDGEKPIFDVEYDPIDLQRLAEQGLLQKKEKKDPMTLKDICMNAILTPLEGDDEKKKFEKWEIYKKLRSAKDEVTLTVEEIATVKKAIGKFYPQLIMGQCFELLEK